MAVTLDQTIAQKQHTFLSRLLANQTFWVVIAVILGCLFLSFATDSFATSKNLFNITRNVTFVAIVALGMTFVIITGGIDLSVGAVVGFTTVVVALLINAGWPIWAAVLITLLVGVAIGLFHGFGIVKM
ncbi:MAG: ABC transporter permease, partial [Mesorhizobium sp.]